MLVRHDPAPARRPTRGRDGLLPPARPDDAAPAVLGGGGRVAMVAVGRAGGTGDTPDRLQPRRPPTVDRAVPVAHHQGVLPLTLPRRSLENVRGVRCAVHRHRAEPQVLLARLSAEPRCRVPRWPSGVRLLRDALHPYQLRAAILLAELPGIEPAVVPSAEVRRARRSAAEAPRGRARLNEAGQGDGPPGGWHEALGHRRGDGRDAVGGEHDAEDVEAGAVGGGCRTSDWTSCVTTSSLPASARPGRPWHPHPAAKRAAM
jgi:hypothetical protein